MSAFGGSSTPLGAPPAGSTSNTGTTAQPSLFGNAATSANASGSGTGSPAPSNFFAIPPGIGASGSSGANTPKPSLFGGGGTTTPTPNAFSGLTTTPNAFSGAAGSTFGGGSAGGGTNAATPNAFSGLKTTPNAFAGLGSATSAFGGGGGGGGATSAFGGGGGGGGAISAFGGGGGATSAFGGGGGGGGSASTSTPSAFGGLGAGNTSMPTAVGSGLGAGTSTPGVSGGTGGAGTSTPSLLSRLGEANTSTPSGTGGANTSTPSPFGGLGVTNTTTPSPFAGLGGGSTSTPSAFGGGASKPNLFGNIGASTSTPTTNTTSTAIPNFFAKPPENKDTPASTLSGFGILGQGQKNAGTAAGEKKDTAPPTGIPNFFGNKATSSTATEKKDSAAPPMLGLFGSKDTGAATAEKKDGAPASLPTFNLFPPKDAASKNTQPISSFALGSTTANKDGDKSKAPSTTPGATAGAAAQALGATTTAAGLIAFPPPSVLRGKTIEEIVNRWTNEIDLHVHEFNKFAGEVAVWDRALIDNGNNLAALYALVLAAEREQNDIDQSLDHIEQQQRDLGGALEAYERSTDEVLGGRGSNLRALDTGPADTERDKNYMLATELHGHLDDLSGSLTQMIDAVNALALPSGSTAGAPKDGGEDPVGQIAQILNSHLESLLWIDGAAREVETTINDVEKRVRAAGDGSLGSTFNKSRGPVDVGR